MSIYVYGFVRSHQAPVPEGTRGVGEPAGTVRSVPQGDLAALVSEAPDDLKPRRRDLMAHQEVLVAAGATGSVLPLRFGCLAHDEASVRRVLAERAGHFRERLDALEGRREFNVKAAHREEEVLRLVLTEEPELQALNEAQRARGGDAGYQERVRLGELMADAVRRREAVDARRIEQELEPYADAVSPGPGSEAWLANISFLVPDDRVDDFTGALARLNAAEAHVDVRVYGPLPPYSFAAAEPGPAAQHAGQGTTSGRR
ncbi:GvpL/GvpF family gas vesicle protein [Streptomyces sp. WMMC500]|uniref:GvpL/GvpF family gas vesicle protein n=1 Tax=Streptomyces sp. WMMC500 TaxID=3015154 RepID=UPI00248B6EEB|nr:GvpL/GvpF family gas vesicle protein [Streptomyces sp. WMMC500]WBB62912.1 GvpL/GvpF family gas vesicle protein [Streptomyces sp. WMMC500]